LLALKAALTLPLAICLRAGTEEMGSMLEEEEVEDYSEEAVAEQVLMELEAEEDLVTPTHRIFLILESQKKYRFR